MMPVMTDAYRDAALSCPACGAGMEARPIDGATIDVCPECAGVWADWFDGDLQAVIRQAPGARGRGTTSAGSASCPRCRRPLDGEGIPGAVGQGIFRCAECVGAFVPRGSFGALIDAVVRSPERGPPNSPLARLIALLKRLLG